MNPSIHHFPTTPAVRDSNAGEITRYQAELENAVNSALKNPGFYGSVTVTLVFQGGKLTNGDVTTAKKLTAPKLHDQRRTA